MSDYVSPFREVAQHFQLRLAAPLDGAARRFGVVVLDGAFDGVPVHVYRATSAADGRYGYVWVRAERRVPGDLGLSIARTTAVGSFFRRLVGSVSMGIGAADGDERFDTSFEVKGAEPVRVRTLFTPELRAALVQWLDAARADADRHRSLLWGLWADDEHVYLELEPEAWAWKVFDRTIAIDELTNALRTVTSLARSFDAASAAVPPSPAFAAESEAWRVFAESRRLGFSASPLRLWGAFADVEFAARALTTPGGERAVELRRRFRTPLPFFLRVKPRRRGDFWTWDPDGPHERLDDAAFDDAFTILTSDLAATRALFTEPLKRAMLDLDTAGEGVFVDPDGMAVHREDLGPASFEAVLAKIAAAEALV